MILDSIKTIFDLRKLDEDQLCQLSEEIRELIIDVVSSTGGHLASSLGVIELTIALHYVFNTPKDKIIWDVGHQCYAHKILTGRKDKFNSLRQLDGISGFPKMSESKFDTYNTGHSSTSLSLAVGDAIARDLRDENYKIVAVIGDGSMTAGMAFEALNQIGHLKNDIIIILNDNEHSISKNVGALSEYLMRIITGTFYNRLRRKSYEIIQKIPKIGESIYKFLYKTEASLKGILVPGYIFEELGIRYFGPVDGHNISLMIDILSRIKKINKGPKIVHVITKKGKGYRFAEMNPDRFHGIGPFYKETGAARKSEKLTYSDIAGKTLAVISKRDKKIIAITAAMKLGTGLYEFEKTSPERFFDVGIAEQHAMTFAAALAAKGFKPFLSVYSTFLQRAIDQLIHDIALMNLPVRILIDRAGIVGNDGETHHGLFDISIVKNVPNIMFFSPSNGIELRDMIYFASTYDEGPIAIRYSRGSIGTEYINYSDHNPFQPGKAKRLTRGKDIAIFALGDMVDNALEVHRLLREKGFATTVVNILSIKPLDIQTLKRTIKNTAGFITIENGYLSGGLGELILASLGNTWRSKHLFSAGFPDEFIPHGSNEDLMRKYGIDPHSIFRRILKFL